MTGVGYFRVFRVFLHLFWHLCVSLRLCGKIFLPPFSCASSFLSFASVKSAFIRVHLRFLCGLGPLCVKTPSLWSSCSFVAIPRDKKTTLFFLCISRRPSRLCGYLSDEFFLSSALPLPPHSPSFCLNHSAILSPISSNRLSALLRGLGLSALKLPPCGLCVLLWQSLFADSV